MWTLLDVVVFIGTHHANWIDGVNDDEDGHWCNGFSLIPTSIFSSFWILIALFLTP